MTSDTAREPLPDVTITLSGETLLDLGPKGRLNFWENIIKGAGSPAQIEAVNRTLSPILFPKDEPEPVWVTKVEGQLKPTCCRAAKTSDLMWEQDVWVLGTYAVKHCPYCGAVLRAGPSDHGNKNGEIQK